MTTLPTVGVLRTWPEESREAETRVLSDEQLEKAVEQGKAAAPDA